MSACVVAPKTEDEVTAGAAVCSQIKVDIAAGVEVGPEFKDDIIADVICSNVALDVCYGVVSFDVDVSVVVGPKVPDEATASFVVLMTRAEVGHCLLYSTEVEVNVKADVLVVAKLRKMTRKHRNSGIEIEIDRMLLGCVDAGEADIHVVEGKVGVLSLHKKNLLSQCCNISKLTVRKKLFESNKLFGEDICVFISKMNAVEVTCMVSEYLLVHCKL